MSRTSPIGGWAIVRLWLAWLPLTIAVPAPSLAQDQTPQSPSRTAALVAEREKKATELSPPGRGKVEGGLYWYDNQYVLSKLFGGWQGFRLGGGDFPAGAGMKFAVGFDRDLTTRSPVLDPTRPNRVVLNGVAAYSTRGYVRGLVGVNIENIGGAPLDARVRTQYFKYPQEDFFGLGPDSRKQDRTDYLLKGTETGADVRWKLAKFIDLGGGVAYLTPEIGSGTDRRFPSTERVFDAATLPGFNQQPDFFRTDGSLALDWRDNPLHPHGGGLYGVQVSRFDDRNLHAYDFRRARLEVQQYVPLPNRYRTIALRAAAVLTDADSGQQVPFFYQPTLGGGRELRGFREFRFRDRNSLALTAEYRWEAWWAMDGALFVDAGTVAANRRDLKLRDLDVSYGIGFRVHSNSAFIARLDLAFSREGFIPLLRFEHVF